MSPRGSCTNLEQENEAPIYIHVAPPTQKFDILSGIVRGVAISMVPIPGLCSAPLTWLVEWIETNGSPSSGICRSVLSGPPGVFLPAPGLLLGLSDALWSAACLLSQLAYFEGKDPSADFAGPLGRAFSWSTHELPPRKMDISYCSPQIASLPVGTRSPRPLEY